MSEIKRLLESQQNSLPQGDKIEVTTPDDSYSLEAVSFAGLEGGRSVVIIGVDPGCRDINAMYEAYVACFGVISTIVRHIASANGGGISHRDADILFEELGHGTRNVLRTLVEQRDKR